MVTEAGEESELVRLGSTWVCRICKLVGQCWMDVPGWTVFLHGGLVISVVGQFSDLAESLIKRDGDVKDSGKIIHGHGGVFDRFDSYIFAAPAVYYVLMFIK